MLHTPAFKAHLHLVFVQPDKVFLMSEFAQRVVRGRTSLQVIGLINGERTTDEIVAALESHMSRVQVYYVLGLLEKHGYIEEVCPEIPPSKAAYWHSLGIDTRLAVERLKHVTVQVRVVGEIAVQPLFRELNIAGVQLLDAAEADLWVVLTDDYLRDELAEINRAALALGKPWLLVRPTGVEFWVGPLFRSQVIGCWACLQARIRANRASERYLHQMTGQHVLFPPRAVLPSTNQMALSMAVHEISRWIVSGQSALEGKMISFHTGHLQTKEHLLVPRPHCVACGKPSEEVSLSVRPIVLREDAEIMALDGGYRGVSPEKTIKTYNHLISSICGIIPVLKRISGENERFCHIYGSGPNQAMDYKTYDALVRNIRSFNCGKGIGDDQSRASAIGEALERYSGYFQGGEPREYASMEHMAGRALDPRTCMLYSEDQYRNRSAWNSRQNPFEFVALPFDPEMPISWSPLWSLTRNEISYLPTSYCYYNFCEDEKHKFCIADSNGCASGNSVDEAILQGFLELVERDCIAIWWYNRIRRPIVDLASFEEPYIEKLLDYYHKKHREVWVLDVSNDLGIPTFVALSRRIDQPVETILFAAGCHLDPQIALLRALTELNQVTVSLGDLLSLENRQLADSITETWLRQATLATEPYLAPDPALPARRKQDMPLLGGTNLRDNILLCKQIVEQRGMELLVLDQTRADVGMPVVKVVVPGLRFFWRRLAPGRLYDVPVQLGWLPAPLREDQLNPKTIFI